MKLLARQELKNGGWARAVIVTQDRRRRSQHDVDVYRVRVERDVLRRKWVGSVWAGSVKVWEDDVHGSLGAEGLLERAGVVTRHRTRRIRTP